MTGPHDPRNDRSPDDADTQEIPVIGPTDDSATVPNIPQAPPQPTSQPSWLDFDDDEDDDGPDSVFDTTGGDADITVVAARPPASTGYTSLPPEAFAPATANAPKKRTLAIIAAAVVVLAAIIGGSVLLFTGGDEPAEAVADDGPNSSQPEQADTGDVDCPSATIGNVTTGRDAGSQDSGVEVIKAFNHAYYVDRDAQAAAAFIHPTGLDRIIPSIDGLQKFLDEMPAGTTYCLAITDQGEGQFRNEITETAPDGKVSPYYQRIQTGEENGRWFILSNTPLDN